MDGTTKIHHKIEHIFPQIKKTDKHKLSPTEENGNKKLKVEETNDCVEPPTAAGVYNTKITEKSGSLGCVDTRSEEEIKELKDSLRTLHCGLTKNPNVLIDVIDKCEALGKDLANILIEKGAIQVMKVTQDFIASSIKKS